MAKRARCPYCERLFNREQLDEHLFRCRAKAQRKATQTSDYQRCNVVVDGTNVAYYLAPDSVPRVANLMRAHKSLVNAGLKTVIVEYMTVVESLGNRGRRGSFVIEGM